MNQIRRFKEARLIYRLDTATKGLAKNKFEEHLLDGYTYKSWKVPKLRGIKNKFDQLNSGAEIIFLQPRGMKRILVSLHGGDRKSVV